MKPLLLIVAFVSTLNACAVTVEDNDTISVCAGDIHLEVLPKDK